MKIGLLTVLAEDDILPETLPLHQALCVDFDDFHESNHRLDLLQQLRTFNPAFRCTLFAVPALGTPGFWQSVPEWCELAVHGWLHPDPHECADWTADRMRELIAAKPPRFVEGFKAPGWQISDGCYQALAEAGWWVADQHYNDQRRPAELRVHCEGDGDHWHGHIQNVCGNGLEERWDELVDRVRRAETFQLVREAVYLRPHTDDPGTNLDAARGEEVGAGPDLPATGLRTSGSRGHQP